METKKVSPQDILVKKEVVLNAGAVMAIKHAFELASKNAKDTIETSVAYREVEKLLGIDPQSLQNIDLEALNSPEKDDKEQPNKDK